jgi:diguanylate cyclase (GGDEF)-like protein
VVKPWLFLLISDSCNFTPISTDFYRFKQYNDHYGHSRGDDCLAAVARILRDCMLRTSDLMARYGGEEFVALLPETTADGAIAVAKRCLTQISSARMPHDTSDVAPYVTVSIGAATVIPTHAHESTIIVEYADDCLYQAKNNGRNRIKTIVYNIDGKH